MSLKLLSALNTQLGELIERAQGSPNTAEKAAIFSAAYALVQHFEAMLALCEDPQHGYLTRHLRKARDHLYAALGYAEPGVDSLINASLAQNTLRLALKRKLREEAAQALVVGGDEAPGAPARPRLALVWSAPA